MPTNVPRRANKPPPGDVKPNGLQYHAPYGDGIRATVSGPAPNMESELRRTVYDALRTYAPHALEDLESHIRAYGYSRQTIDDWTSKYLDFHSGGFNFDVWFWSEFGNELGAPFPLASPPPRVRRLLKESRRLRIPLEPSIEKTPPPPPDKRLKQVIRGLRRGPLGTATLDITISWSLPLDDVANDSVERAILKHVGEGIRRELRTLRSERNTRSPKGREREHLARDATRLVLREVRSLSLEQIMTLEDVARSRPASYLPAIMHSPAAPGSSMGRTRRSARPGAPANNRSLAASLTRLIYWHPHLLRIVVASLRARSSHGRWTV